MYVCRHAGLTKCIDSVLLSYPRGGPKSGGLGCGGLTPVCRSSHARYDRGRKKIEAVGVTALPRHA